MTKKKNINPIDDLTERLSNAFNSVKDEKGVLSEEEVMKIKTTIATGLLSINGSKDLIAEKFLPAARTEIRTTKNYILKSKYANHLKDTYNQIDELHYEVIRMGYVLTFHKYENFINDVLLMIESLISSDITNTLSLSEYMKRKFHFHPKQWYKNQSTHIVNFIANCTKHSDGKCKLDNKSSSIPRRYLHLSETDIIRPSLKEYKEDIKNLIDSFNILLQIMFTCNMTRTLENNITSDELSGFYSHDFIEDEKRHLSIIEASVNTLISLYSM